MKVSILFKELLRQASYEPVMKRCIPDEQVKYVPWFEALARLELIQQEYLHPFVPLQ